MRVLAVLLGVLLAWLPSPASAQTIRALFVGIDVYQYSSDNENKLAVFKDLKGAVADTVRFKNALREVYKLEVDRAIPDVCMSANAVSTTLTNTCATRTAILDGLDKMIDMSGPGDTLIFYFAGHGSQFSDDVKFRQASGRNSTILPTDARQPDALIDGDILDTELKAKKDRATAKGVYFVSVFDSCNSGTATRDGAAGQTRSVPILVAKPPERPQPAAPSGPGGGYWVHLAAAQDGEQAHEVGAIGQRAGVFTSALIATMQNKPFATFGDMIREVQAKVAARGHMSQNPVAEGELKASLGSKTRRAISFDAEAVGDTVTLKAGKLSGMTEGSLFALFPDQISAFTEGTKPLATARIASLDAYAAVLALDSAPLKPLSKALTALETRHAFGDQLLVVANLATQDADRRLIKTALDGMAFVTQSGDAQMQVAIDPANLANALLLASDGTRVGDLGALSAPDFANKLGDRLKKVLRVQQLLALRTDVDQSAIRFCIDDSIYGPKKSECPALERGGERVLKVGGNAFVTVENLGTAPRYLYVFGIDPTYGVALILPRPGENDDKIAPQRPHRIPDDPVVPTAPGQYRFVTIASEEQINAAALEQDGTNARGAVGCDTALERLLCSAKTGTRDPSAPKVGNWTAIVESVVVE